MIDFVIINYKTGDLTCNCITSIYDTYSKNARILVVDNASPDDSIHTISKIFPEVKIIKNEQNKGYAYAVNVGVRATKSEFVIVSNADVEFHPNSLYIAEKALSDDEKIGISGFYEFYPGGKPQRSFGYFPGFKLGLMDLFFITGIRDDLHIISRKNKNNSTKIHEVEYADGACLLVRRDVFEKLNGFDENFFFYTEETDFCRRVWDLGFKVVVNPSATITHYRGASSSQAFIVLQKEKMLAESQIRFVLKHGSKFEARFYKYAQCFHYLALSFREYLVSILSFKKRYKLKSKMQFQYFKVWLDVTID
jgi:hypothetical protein